MTMISKSRFALPALFGVLLMVTLSACDGDETTANTPNSTDTTQESQTMDGQSETRQNQLESDARAREQRNDTSGNSQSTSGDSQGMMSGSQNQTEGELSSQVQSKLATDIPGSNLTVTGNDAEVTVSGTVRTQQELAQIEPSAREVSGVNNVIVRATVTQ